MTRKLIIHDGRAERELLLVGTILVGRDPTCHISDLDPLLSRRHAEFVTTPQSVTLRDLGSRNGIMVNGAKTREHVLAEGDLIQLGHLQLRYLEDHRVPAREAAVRAHATTASSSNPGIAAPRQQDVRLPLNDLDDTQTHEHATPPAANDDDPTRVPIGRTAAADDEPTRVPIGRTAAADDEPTRVPIVRTAPAPSAAGDLNTTVAPASKAPRPDVDAAVAPVSGNLDATVAPRSRERDATVAPTLRDPDATFAPTSRDLGATRVSRDLDATVVLASRDLDATIAPGAIDFDATFIPLSGSATAVMAPPADQDHARVVAGADMRVQSANAACRQAFGIEPDTLVGQSLTDLVARSLQTLAAGDGPASFSVVLERQPAERTIRATFKAGQTAETMP